MARYIGDNKELNNWRGQGTLHAKVRGDNSGNAIGLQIGTSAGVYFHTDIKLDFEGWKTIDIPLLNNPALVQSWSDDANRGKTMTSDDLKTIKEIVVASNQQNSENSSIAFALGELSLIPSEKAEESSPAPTLKLWQRRPRLYLQKVKMPLIKMHRPVLLWRRMMRIPHHLQATRSLTQMSKRMMSRNLHSLASK